MGGSHLGGKKAEKTMIAKMGEAQYREWRRDMGRKGGKNSRGGGYATTHVGDDGLTGPQRASYWGRIGGIASRKPKEQAGGE